MAKLSFGLPVTFSATHDRLAEHATFVKRNQCEEAPYRGPGNLEVRFRRLDTITKLVWHDDAGNGVCTPMETVIIDPGVCKEFLERLGFQACPGRRFIRESWKKHHYTLQLDRSGTGSDLLTVECELEVSADLGRVRRQAMKCLAAMGIEPLETGPKRRIDSSTASDYTAPVKPKAFSA